jgi:hypothetical protein
MRAVVQLVSRAHVAADGSVTGEIAMGLLILLGVGRGDTSAVAASMAEKISNLRLEDWFVPVLFHEKDDPQLFREAPPSKQTVEDFQAALATRLGEQPPMPGTGFIGRSRELVALQRLLRHEPYAVWSGVRAEKARPHSPVSSPAGWCGHSRCIGRRLFPWRRTVYRCRP